MLELDFDLNDLCSKTDEELVAVAKNDKSAAGILLSRYSKLILIKSKIYANSDTDSEDLHQEGFISLLKAINAYDPSQGAKFSTFAEKCIVNRMKTVSARMGRNCSDVNRIDEDEAADVLSVEETPESIFLYKEFFDELLGSIDSLLSDAELQAFRLCISGMTYKQAAHKLGVTEKSVDNAMQRARRKIRALYKKRMEN
ncbi:MAG: sigma-70 family RNA polymerase sigma factor [Ruminococcus sp.]|nr:sigma-70 family RNA polymerase sigma factor [Ruminococcus sp.]MBP7185454.1 sigma-70 family RNA polymerase sigma factor [Ruminococcus sp.]